jgi:hypothetical protein
MVAMDSPVMMMGDMVWGKCLVCRADLCATILYVMIEEGELVAVG